MENCIPGAREFRYVYHRLKDKEEVLPPSFVVRSKLETERFFLVFETFTGTRITMRSSWYLLVSTWGPCMNQGADMG